MVRLFLHFTGVNTGIGMSRRPLRVIPRSNPQPPLETAAARLIEYGKVCASAPDTLGWAIDIRFEDEDSSADTKHKLTSSGGANSKLTATAAAAATEGVRGTTPACGISIGSTGDYGLVNSSYTIECWVKLDDHDQTAGSPDRAIVACDHSGLSVNAGLHVIVRDGCSYFAHYGDDTRGAPLPNGVWTHLACVYDIEATTQSIFHNVRQSECDLFLLTDSHPLLVYRTGRWVSGFVGCFRKESQPAKSIGCDTNRCIRRA